MADYEIFELGNLVLQSGLTLRHAQLAYKTYGTLNSRKDNAIVYPTFYGGQHAQNEPMIGPGRALDPSRYFIIIPKIWRRAPGTRHRLFHGRPADLSLGRAIL